MRAAFLNGVEWPQFSQIRVFFFKNAFVHESSGTLMNAEYTKAKADWVEKVVTRAYAGLVNLQFVWNVPQNKSNVRITFVKNLGAYSNVGNSSELVSIRSETMNLGWLDENDSADPQLRMTGAVVLHEFGHCLGLIHEHMRDVRDTKIQWNKALVYAEMKQPPNSWDKKTVDSNIFNTFDRTKINGSVYDRDSIMHYVFPPQYFIPPRVIQQTKVLSAMDIATIRQKYPIPALPPSPPPPRPGPPPLPGPPPRPIIAPPAPPPFPRPIAVPPAPPLTPRPIAVPPAPVTPVGPIAVPPAPVTPVGPIDLERPSGPVDPTFPITPKDPPGPVFPDLRVDPIFPITPDNPPGPVVPVPTDGPSNPADIDPLDPTDIDPLDPTDIDPMKNIETYLCKEAMTAQIVYYLIPALALLILIILSLLAC